MKYIFKFLLVAAALLFANAYAPGAAAAPLGDADALRGQHEAKAVFMINVDDPRKLGHVLKVIEETDSGLAKQKVKPHLVVVVIGPAVAFLTKDRRGIPYMEQAAVAHAQAALGKLDAMGVRLEACGVALKGMDLKPEDVIPVVHPVGNGYISAIGYQAQGYGLVPVY
ncbi:MAG TPA: DsrE family protein [Burkholderiales bacterium]|nr:DsrE family protein [Burkholderiales bacterium]